MKVVIVIEDDQMVREMIATILSDSGYTVHKAAIRDDALPFLHKKPNVILMDRLMPGMEPEGFLDEVKLSCPEARVVMMSGNYDRSEADRLGIPHFVPKPFGMHEILSAVS